MSVARKVTVEFTSAEIILVLECIGEFTSANAYDAGEYRKCTGRTLADFRRLVKAENKLETALRATRNPQ